MAWHIHEAHTKQSENNSYQGVSSQSLRRKPNGSQEDTKLKDQGSKDGLSTPSNRVPGAVGGRVVGSAAILLRDTEQDVSRNEKSDRKLVLVEEKEEDINKEKRPMAKRVIVLIQLQLF